MSKSRDIFIDKPPLKPKQDIADIIESRGFLVPKRFADLNSALAFVKQGGELIIRSEHPLEYAGAAGLLESYKINLEKLEKYQNFFKENNQEIDWEKYCQKYYDNDVTDPAMKIVLGSMEQCSQELFEENLKKLSWPQIRNYCDLLELNVNDFCEQMGYSYWEKINGFNRSIVLDSAISGRYHVFTSKNEAGNIFHNYSVVDNHQVVISGPCPLTEELSNGLEEAIKFYEDIRQLDIFDINHCPIIEFQTHENKNYFLQTHRTRDIKAANWKLERPPEKGEVEVIFVRGTTPREGLNLDVVVYYPGEDMAVKDFEDGSFDLHYMLSFSEIMSRRRVVNLEFCHTPIDLLIKSHDAHLPKSKIFNPEIFVAIAHGFLTDEAVRQFYRSARDTQKPSLLKIRLVSDGRKAYIKIL